MSLGKPLTRTMQLILFLSRCVRSDVRVVRYVARASCCYAGNWS
jgi:hypothetical protein